MNPSHDVHQRPSALRQAGIHERTFDAAGLHMGEIEDPALRLKLLRLCVELAEVDARVDEGESMVLVAAAEHWGLHHETFRLSSRN